MDKRQMTASIKFIFLCNNATFATLVGIQRVMRGIMAAKVAKNSKI
jgi:hypothetical protein